MKLFWQKKKKGFPTTIFVMASLLAFITFINIFVIFSILSASQRMSNKVFYSAEDKNRYFFNEDFNFTDPFITKSPNIDNILAGPIITPLDPSIGDEDAPVVVVQFSDFECQVCRDQEEIIKKVFDDNKDKIRVIWKDFPEKNVSSNSYQAAIAARCAQNQGKFWEYHGLLYLSDELTNEAFLSIADKLKLNEGEFKSCLESGIVNNKINDNIIEASALDINGIPFIYVNRQEILGSISYEDLDKIIKLEIDKLE